jgi:hypothetical protein
MPIADMLSGRFGLAGRLPGHLDDLRGPAKGVVMLPMHLSWPGMRECDVSDDRTRRSMYGMLLSQGKRNDVVRFVNAGLLTQDWPAIADSLEPKLRRWCERQFVLGAGASKTEAATTDPAATSAGRPADAPFPAPEFPAVDSDGGPARAAG